MKIETGENTINLCNRCVILGNIVIHRNAGGLSKNFSVWLTHRGRNILTVETNHLNRKLLADVREAAEVILELNKLSQKLDG